MGAGLAAEAEAEIEVVRLYRKRLVQPETPLGAKELSRETESYRLECPYSLVEARHTQDSGHNYCRLKSQSASYAVSPLDHSAHAAAAVVVAALTVTNEAAGVSAATPVLDAGVGAARRC